jgi:hypothetical protein
LRYQKNERCLQKYNGEKVCETPQKRQHDELSEEDSPLSQASKSSGLGEILGAYAGMSNHFGKMFPTSKIEQFTQNFEETQQSDDSDGSADAGMFGDYSDDEAEEEEDSIEEEHEDLPDTEICEQFAEYSEYANKNRSPLTPNDEAGVELMDLLIKKRAPLNLYDDIYQWHVKHLKATTFKPKKTLLSDLKDRYNMTDKGPKLIKDMVLPHSRSKIDLVVHYFQQEVQSLLSDPRWTDADYLFHNDDPFSPPPEQFTSIGDINTGLAYRKTYEQLITDPTKDVLLPIIFYMDGAITGQYDHLPIEILKFTLGIFNTKARDKGFSWRNLGYVTKFLGEETEAQTLVLDSGHMDGDFYLPTTKPESDSEEDGEEDGNADENNGDNTDDDDNSDNNPFGVQQENDDLLNPQIADCHAQDLHAMLKKMLETYGEVERGFEWDLQYKGEKHRVTFRPFIMFIKGDTQEHDKHCGRYLSRGEKVSQLCRYCCCPNSQTDEPYATFNLKSQTTIQKLVDNNDDEALRALSQHKFQNCWYLHRFGLHNSLGVHSACPLEMVHWYQLGKYANNRSMFFTQTGKSSHLSNRFNALCKSMGYLFKRQSDRDINRTDFSRGIKGGKLMAHEMSGMIVVLLAAIRTTKGRTILLTQCRGTQKDYFGKIEFIQDWMLLLTTLLQCEAWLKEQELRVYDVRRFKTKVKEIMNMEKMVGRRQAGMGFRTFKFHAALHVADDILNFGVPSNVNTMSNEMHHKPSKTAAIHTQRRAKIFDWQCANNLHNMEVIDIAMEEIMNHNNIWDYYNREADENTAETVDEQSTLGVEVRNTGARVEFFYDAEGNNYKYRIQSKMLNQHKFKLGKELMAFLETTINLLGDDVNSLSLFTEHKRFNQIFRASPYFLDKPWRDWAMIDWGNNNILPGQIWIFVDLTEIQDSPTYEPGIYAVIESADANMDENEIAMTELFVPYTKETDGVDENGKIKRKFYLVDVEAIHSPTIVIPDLGNENPAAYLRMVPKTEWTQQFITWLASEHTREFD